jgi:hypothetical protein
MIPREPVIYRWEGKIETCLKETGCEDTCCIQYAGDKDKRWAFLKTVINNPVL